MAFAPNPTELERELVNRNYEDEFSRTHDYLNQDLTGVVGATALTGKRNTMFTKMDAKDLPINSIVILGNMTTPWTAHDTFHSEGQNIDVHTLALYVYGGQFESSGRCVLKLLLPLLKRPNRGAGAAKLYDFTAR